MAMAVWRWVAGRPLLLALDAVVLFVTFWLAYLARFPGEITEGAGMAAYLGPVVNMSVAAELGPVLAGVMLAGRVGGALTAELGTMNVTEQLLALRGK